MKYHLTLVSSNQKTGPMPTSTSSDETCPDSCPLKGTAGCYARNGPLRRHWEEINKGKRGVSFQEFCQQIEKLPRGSIWRHNQAGDLPGLNSKIDKKMMRLLVQANRKASAHGFTYTHKPPTKENLVEIKYANDNGFTVNMSADTIEEADVFMKLRAAPVVVLLPRGAPESFKTPAGHKVVTCPAQTRDRMICLNCKLCCDPDRQFIVGFQAHGSGARIVEEAIKIEEAKSST